jgi:hypothetical protein
MKDPFVVVGHVAVGHAVQGGQAFGYVEISALRWVAADSAKR